MSAVNIAECDASGKGQTLDLDMERDQLLGSVAELESKLRAVSTERDQLVLKAKESVAENDKLKSRVVDLESKLAAACDDRNMLVKYCGKTYQTARQQAECEARVAELLDEALFTQPRMKECPICFLLQPPAHLGLAKFYPCCGIEMCSGCHLVIEEEREGVCPFCRAPAPASDQEVLDRLNKRVAANDAGALYHLGDAYRDGDYGLPQDMSRAMQLLMRGAELGSMECHYDLGAEYEVGEGVEKNRGKTLLHFQIAAMGGHVLARYCLGLLEVQTDRMDRAMRHFMIAARAGNDYSMRNVRFGYKNGHVAKDELLATTRAHKDSQDAMKSDQRDRAARDGD